MTEALSCGGVVIYRWKILLLYKNQNGKYMGWVLPKGTVEDGESFQETALREVKEESGSNGKVIKYLGKTNYIFKGEDDMINKTVHWYFMMADSFYCKPQKEEYFADAGFYKFHEAYHLLKFNDERQILKRAYEEYNEMKKSKNEFPRKNFFKGYN
ncbi:MAG: NUDIX hydrolase [Lachnospiraceae bacterium]|nr:NUDIX hydrolase [Lachnospiraceae bacterium]